MTIYTLLDKTSKRIETLSKQLRKDRSAVARELIDHGWEFLMIKRYKDGKLSLAGLASELDVSVSEALDLLAELGVEAPIEYDDYLKGLGLLAASHR